jgi:alkaline phosphatase D
MRLDMSTLPFAGYHDSVFNIDGWAGYPFELSVLMRYLEEENVSGLVSLSGDHHMQGAGTIRQSTTAADAPAVAVDFNVAGISSSPLFEDLIAVAKEDHTGFGPLVYRETEDGTEPVWNVSMLSGVLAAFAYGKTGFDTLTDWLGPNSANPGLQYVDTTANGYGLASFDADEMQVQLITMEDCQVPFIEPPGIRHIAKFHLPHWSAGEPPVLDGPDFERAAPFPFKAPTV